MGRFSQYVSRADNINRQFAGAIADNAAVFESEKLSHIAPDRHAGRQFDFGTKQAVIDNFHRLRIFIKQRIARFSRTKACSASCFSRAPADAGKQRRVQLCNRYLIAAAFQSVPNRLKERN